jgi:hypothetical protein
LPSVESTFGDQPLSSIIVAVEPTESSQQTGGTEWLLGSQIKRRL